MVKKSGKNKKNPSKKKTSSNKRKIKKNKKRNSENIFKSRVKEYSQKNNTFVPEKKKLIPIKKTSPTLNLYQKPGILNKFKRTGRNIMRKIRQKDKVALGIPKFDDITHGGFEEQSINLITGGSGSGKSIFAMHFLLEGIKQGENVLYVTFEEKKEEFYENMKKFGWNLEEVEKTGKFLFLEYSPEKVKMMLDEGGGAIENTILKGNIKRMVIDSITSFSLLFEDKLSKRQSLLALFDIIRKWDCTTLLTVQHDPINESEDISSINFEADSITLLYNLRRGGKRERYIEVLKMRGTNHSKDLHPFIIDEKGIQIG